MKVHYTFQQSCVVEDEIELDAGEERAVRAAFTNAERQAILDPLIAAHALSEPVAAHGSHLSSTTFAIDPRPAVEV